MRFLLQHQSELCPKNNNESAVWHLISFNNTFHVPFTEGVTYCYYDKEMIMYYCITYVNYWGVYRGQWVDHAGLTKKTDNPTIFIFVCLQYA